MASTSSTSTFTPQWNFDVFLSFRGEDTRFNFTDHLYANLIRRGITTFRDDESLKRGEEIAPELLEAIEKSRFSLIVFSENYAGSRWCLDELVKIMKCRKEMKQTVVPIFYHVDPSHVRHQKKRFGKAFSNYKEDTEEMKEKVRSWRSALTEAANISGVHVKKNRYESEHVNEIVDDIFKRLNCRMLDVGANLVGMDSHVEEIIRRLCVDQLNDVRIIGICGIGGMGKTTIAKLAYNTFSREFEYMSFLENVREVLGNTMGLHHLQNRLLCDLLQVERNQNVSNVGQGANMIKNVLRCKRVFIVLDDIDDSDQLEYLLRNRDWLGRGSRVIITTRNKHLLHEMDDAYEVEELNFEQARELFSLFAFRQNLPKQDFIHLSDRVVYYCHGLPLALKVLGSLLFNKTILQWENELCKLEREPEVKIHNVLKVSYDGLDYTQKKIFLDIACCFKGEDKDFVSRIWDGCNLYAERGIKVLCDKCLISLSKNKILMHDLIQEMGWNIIRSESPSDPTKWSRLWDPSDVCRAFRMGGMKNVEAIFLDLLRSTPLQVSTKSFAKMKQLRLLKIYSSGCCGTTEKQLVILPEDFQFLAHELRYLHWEGYPLKSLPSNFLGLNLIELYMKYSNIKQLWQGNENLERLKILNLIGSEQLTEISKFSNMPNLEKLELAHCTSLNVVDPSIEVLKKLTKLNLCGCKNLTSLPSSIQYLDSLKLMNLASCSNLEEFPEMEGSPMKALSSLHLDRCGIKELPSSIEHLTGLKVLFMSDCKNLRSLPRSICRLKSLLHINLSGCSNLDTFPEITEDMKYLGVLDLKGTGIKELPSSIQNLKSLVRLSMSTCLVTLPDSIFNLRSLKDLRLRGCSNLEKFPKNPEGLCSLERLDLSHCNLMVSIPSGISQLCKLRDLDISHCKMLQDIPELPSSLRKIDAHGCTKLEMLSSPSSLLWSSLLKWFNPTSNEHLNCKEGKRILILGNGGIPRWVSHQEIGSQVRIEPPLNWYEDDHFLGFAFFTLFRDENHCVYGSQFSLRLRGNPDEVVDDRNNWDWCECDASDLLWVTLHPKNAIPNKYHRKQPWHFLADFVPMGNRRVTHTNNIKRCGVQLIYTHDYLHHNVPMLVDHQRGHDDAGENQADDQEPHPKDFQFLAHELRYLHWEGYTLKSWPSNFLGVNLVELNMEGSNIKQLWQGNENLERLKVLNLTGSKQLTEISKFSNMPNLEKLELAHCTSLNVVDPSIEVLKKLTKLNLCGCKNLTSLPSSIQYLDSLKLMNLASCSNLEEFPEMEGSPMKALSSLHLDRCGIKELPSSIEHLTGLKVLFMSDCKNLRSLPRSICRLKSLLHINLSGCSNLDTFPEITEDMKYLGVLDLKGTGIKELPSSIQNLKSLVRLSMSTCLVTLPDSIFNLRSLKDLRLRGCSNLEKFPKNPEGLCSLERLDLSHCNLMVSIPSGISQLCKLRDLDISHCKMLQDIPELPSSLRKIDAHGCTKLEMLSSPSSLLWSSLLKWFNPTSNEHLNCKEGKRILILGNGGIPRWVSHQEIGSQVRIEPPLNWYEDDHFLGFAFFTLFRDENHCVYGSQFSLRLRGDPDEVVDDRNNWDWCECDASDRLWVTLHPKNAIPNKYHRKQPWHFLADFVPMGNRRVTHTNNIKRCGVQLIYTHDYLHHNVPMLVDHQRGHDDAGENQADDQEPHLQH